MITRDDWETWRAQGNGMGFDEICLGKWLHVERLDTNVYDVHVDGLHVHVSRTRRGIRVVLLDDACNGGKGVLR